MSAKPNTYLFYGQNIRVYISRTDKSPTDKVVICFHGRVAAPGFQKGNFGEPFLRSREIDAIHIQTSVNNWYQSPDLPEALAAAAHAAAIYKHRVTYGSSMGAYAALAFSGPLNATCVTAFVPQYSPMADKVPFETRWKDERVAIAPVMEDMAAQISKTAKIYVSYDPYQVLDRKHFDLIQATGAKITPLLFPMVDHEVLRFLGDTHLIEKVVLETIDGKATEKGYRSLIRDGRRLSSAYLFYSGLRLIRRRHLARGWDYFLKAMDLPAGQFDHYNRMFIQAQRQAPPAGVAEKIAAIVDRRPENANLLKAYNAHQPELIKLFAA
ncbi:MAG: hypothetical protein NVV72_12070 [Asticcacaulis sp.]|nr:hypothetical protein [Asticcacaulis sp.]